MTIHDGTTRTSAAAVGSTDDLVRRAGAVPPLDGFPTLDVLWRRFARIERENPGLVSSRRVATSRLGEPILMYTVGSGSRNHLIVGGVHPNEPIGSWTAIHLAETLCADDELRSALDATWHIVPSIDPDGGRLNEGWFHDPTDRGYYSRRFYRPAPDEQVEWTFPTSYERAYFDRVLPETLGLMRLIDELRPDLYVSLHNGEMGGVYYYLSRPVPELTEALHAVPASLGLPLDTGEPESPYLERYAPAVFGTGTIADAYDYLESLGVDPALEIGGSSSSEYASRYGTLGVVAELPYWKHPDADDASPIDESYADLLLRTSTEMTATGEALVALLAQAEPWLTIESPFLRASRAFVPMLVRMGAVDRARAARPESARAATVSERFSCEDIVHCFRLRYGGMLLRALEAESAAGTATAPLRRLADETAALYATWQAAAAAVDRAEVIPIASLVGVQYGAVLAAAAHLAAASDPETAER
ncbi:M14 family zinc carboxypeptidase [Frigoribacterium faeni]|uniref:Peptidase M14 domain-containing protein n=2 Tax=Frigoribacterium faeni TaxID=145483 RepID=A0A7W3JI81_9MICO|nr:M14 family zinc carboxypeptidase [Frigoribacterium faeni]MBA8813350.1 hypothetical protein [Frigoribacterium faeni]